MQKTLWEIFSGGQVPYGNVTANDLSEAISNGLRLPVPSAVVCPLSMQSLMQQVSHVIFFYLKFSAGMMTHKTGQISKLFIFG